MRLKRSERVGLLVLGAAAAAIAGWAYLRSEMTIAGLLVFVPALVLIVWSIVGTNPNLSYKDARVEWPKGEEPKPLETEAKKATEQLQLELAQTNERLAQIQQLRTELDDTHRELERVSERLEDYILAHEPAPDDELTDEDRLEEWGHQLSELDEDVSSRKFHGEGYTDGISTDDLQKTLERNRDEYRREYRRQEAQFKFGLRKEPPQDSYY